MARAINWDRADPRFVAAVGEMMRQHAAYTEPGNVALGDFLARATRARPEIATVSAAALARCICTAARKLGNDLRAFDGGELWMTAGCADRQPDAVAVFESRYVQQLGASLRALDLDATEIDELAQRVRGRLLTPCSDGSIPLEQYAGRGRLLGFVRVMAARMALDDRRKERRRPLQVSLHAIEVDAVMAGELGPEFALIEGEHRAAMKQAFHQSIGALEPRQRAVLRLHLIGGSSIDEIAALHDVHRSTAARWLVRIRETLGAGVRATLQAQLGLSPSEFHEVLRAVDSRLDLSLSRVLVTANVRAPNTRAEST